MVEDADAALVISVDGLVARDATPQLVPKVQ